MDYSRQYDGYSGQNYGNQDEGYSQQYQSQNRSYNQTQDYQNSNQSYLQDDSYNTYSPRLPMNQGYEQGNYFEPQQLHSHTSQEHSMHYDTPIQYQSTGIPPRRPVQQRLPSQQPATAPLMAHNPYEQQHVQPDLRGQRSISPLTEPVQGHGYAQSGLAYMGQNNGTYNRSVSRGTDVSGVSGISQRSQPRSNDRGMGNTPVPSALYGQPLAEQPQSMANISLIPARSVVPQQSLPGINTTTTSIPSGNVSPSRPRVLPMVPTGPTSPPHIPATGQHFTDNPYKRYSSTWDPQVVPLSDMELDTDLHAAIDSDEEDYAIRGTQNPARQSAGSAPVPTKQPRTRFLPVIPSSRYDAIDSSTNLGVQENKMSAWQADEMESKKKRRKRAICFFTIGVLALMIIAGATAAGIILSRKTDKMTNEDGTGSDSAPLTASSQGIKSLMNNKNLKRSFYGMDYTPLNTALYPECLDNPGTQNNVTRDIAVLSQLTKTVRLYGNDCNQTQLVAEAIKTLKVDMKIWLAVWQDGNATTNARQLTEMYSLLDQYGTDIFEGVILGNENIFRQEITVSQLVQDLAELKTNLTNLKYGDMKIATAQLGSSWTTQLASAVDVLMANVHPFFAGVTVNDAANWTFTFFQGNDQAVAAQTTNKPLSIISEVGWPTAGGTLNGSVAGFTEAQYFIDTFLCAANEQNVPYFWFSAFDEPWKIRFNEPGKEWEDKWGLMDVNRNLKKGIKIPDCQPS